MKLPRDVGGEELARLIVAKYGYRITRQTGSHMRLTAKKGEHQITIPKHKILRVGTLSNILSDIADYLEMDKQDFKRELFGEKK